MNHFKCCLFSSKVERTSMNSSLNLLCPICCLSVTIFQVWPSGNWRIMTPVYKKHKSMFLDNMLSLRVHTCIHMCNKRGNADLSLKPGFFFIIFAKGTDLFTVLLCLFLPKVGFWKCLWYIRKTKIKRDWKLTWTNINYKKCPLGHSDYQWNRTCD